MRHRFRKPSPYELLALALAALGLSGIAYAAIPSAEGKISACYATNGTAVGIPHSKGDTRIVDEGEPCRAYEKAISWKVDGGPAYATVTASGGILLSQSHGIGAANVTKGVAGNYCFHDLPFKARSAVATAEAGGVDDDVIATAEVAAGTVGGGSVGCAAKVLVRTYDVSDASLQNRKFTVWIED